MTDAVRAAIEAADPEALRSLIAADPACRDAEVRWGAGGKNVVPPLHFVCDAVFRGLATQEQGLALAEVLLAAGADPQRAYARSGDTFLITAASLGAEAVGLRLVAQGVDVTPTGLFGAGALHWAAIMGLERLTPALVAAGANLDAVDDEYECTPLQWGLHGWHNGTQGRRDGIPGALRALVQAGARVPPGSAEALVGDEHALLRAALGSRPAR